MSDLFVEKSHRRQYVVDFLSEAKQLFHFTQSIRRDLHRHPELGFQEVRTAGIVARELKELGLEVRTGIAETGVVALLNGDKPGPIVLVRFDMDALPITEETGVEYASQNDGVMHACGHDAHTAIGLTVARMLNEVRDSLTGTLKFVFQPAEELLAGAKRMVDEGVLQNPRPDYSLAMHLLNEKPVGWIGVPPGPAMAAAESFSVHIRGRGGHGAYPHLTRDPIMASAQVITALQSIVSRNIDALETGVVSVTSVRGGRAFNVIPPEVGLLGTIRTYNPKVRDAIVERFHQVVEGVSESMGCHADVGINHLTPAVVNAPELSSRVQEIAATMFPDGDIDTEFRNLGSEDMAYMMDDIAGCYFFIGSSGRDRSLDGSHHDPHFDFDEQAMPLGAALMAATVMDLLRA